MKIEELQATRKPVSDVTWAILVEEGVTEGLPREVFWEYAEGYVLHERDGGFWPHAWWYAPVRKETLAEAEEVLLAWRKEMG